MPKLRGQPMGTRPLCCCHSLCLIVHFSPPSKRTAFYYPTTTPEVQNSFQCESAMWAGLPAPDRSIPGEGWLCRTGRRFLSLSLLRRFRGLVSYCCYAKLTNTPGEHLLQWSTDDTEGRSVYSCISLLGPCECVCSLFQF